MDAKSRSGDCWQGLTDALFAMAEAHLNAIFAVQVLGQMLCRIYGAMLPTGAAEGEHQRGEAALKVTLHMGIGKSVDAFEEGQYLPIFLKELDDGFIETRHFFVLLIATRIVRGTAVEYVAATIAALVLGDSLAVRETEDADDEVFGGEG